MMVDQRLDEKYLMSELQEISLRDPFNPYGFGSTLRMFRQAIGLSQAKLAAAAGMNERTIRRIEDGCSTTSRTMRIIARTAAALAVSPGVSSRDFTDEAVWDLFRKRHPGLYRSFTETVRLIMEKPESKETSSD